MRKVLLCLILLSFVCKVSFSQEESNRNGNKSFFASIGVGVSMPNGSFGSVSGTDNSHGAANNGFCIYGSYGYTSNNLLGLKVAISINSYSADQLIDTTFMNIGLPPDVHLITDVGRWTNINMLVGPTLNYGIGRSQISMSLLGGLTVANRPSVGHNFFTNNNLIWIYYISSGKGMSFCVRPEINYIYSINKRFGLLFNISYSYSNPTLEYKAEYPLLSSGWKYKDLETRQKITAIDIGLSLLIKMK